MKVENWTALSEKSSEIPTFEWKKNAVRDNISNEKVAN